MASFFSVSDKKMTRKAYRFNFRLAVPAVMSPLGLLCLRRLLSRLDNLNYNVPDTVSVIFFSDFRMLMYVFPSISIRFFSLIVKLSV